MPSSGPTRVGAPPSNRLSASCETRGTPPVAHPTGGVSVTTQGLFSARCLYFAVTGHTVRAEWPRLASQTLIVFGRVVVNKAELIDALAARLGDKKSASNALDAVLAEIQTAVTKGDKVAITGFGVFEKRVRAARTARNPRTGEAVKVKKTSVPAFRAGASFKDQVASGKVPRVAAAKKTATKATASKATTAKATKSTAKSAPAKKTATKATATKTATKAPARKTATKTTRAASTPARRTTTAKAAPAASTRKAPRRKAR